MNVPIFVGGLIYWIFSRLLKPAAWQAAEQRGVLLASGIIAGDALMGIGLAFLAMFGLSEVLALRSIGESHFEDLVTLAAFSLLVGAFIYLVTHKDRERLSN